MVDSKRLERLAGCLSSEGIVYRLDLPIQARSYYSVPTCIDSLDRNPGSTATRPATTTTNVTISSFASLLGEVEHRCVCNI